MNEIWKDVVGYENLYQVSNLGRVRSLDKKVRCKNKGYRITRGKILRSQINYKGYECITLTKDKKRKSFKLHRLVAMAFIPCNNKKLQINHIDGNKLNNKVENLEWVTCKENIEHSIKNKLTNYKYKNKKIVVVFNSIKEASRKLNIDKNIISRRLDKEKEYNGMYFQSNTNKERK